MMHKVFLSIFLVAFASITSAEVDNINPRLNADNVYELPENFRLINGPFSPNIPCEATREGLEKLRVSGSGQFSELGFKQLLTKVDTTKLVIVDLRAEFHGFLNGRNVFWKGSGKTPYAYSAEWSAKEIEDREEARLLELLTQKTGVFNTDAGPVTLPVNEVQTEHQLVKGSGFIYFRIPIIHGKGPSDEEVDNFLAFFKITSFRSWIHVHCAGGNVRTTMAMSMLDILSNPHLPLETILRRQEAIGGVNLYDPEKYCKGKPEKLPDAKERLVFLNQFHQYVNENPYFLEKWSSWASKQKKSA